MIVDVVSICEEILLLGRVGNVVWRSAFTLRQAQNRVPRRSFPGPPCSGGARWVSRWGLPLLDGKGPLRLSGVALPGSTAVCRLGATARWEGFPGAGCVLGPMRWRGNLGRPPLMSEAAGAALCHGNKTWHINCCGVSQGRCFAMRLTTHPLAVLGDQFA